MKMKVPCGNCGTVTGIEKMGLIIDQFEPLWDYLCPDCYDLLMNVDDMGIVVHPAKEKANESKEAIFRVLSF